MDLTDRIGRRLKLHDLHVLIAVAQAGSMGKAARNLNTTQPAVSRSIAELENALGVRLLERSAQGVEPTVYGRALLDCGSNVFDDLRQGVKKIEFLADPTVGEVKIGGNESIIAGLLPAILSRLRGRYPEIVIHGMSVTTLAQQYRHLREREVDLILGRIAPIDADDVVANILFYEQTYVVAGLQNRWSRRRKIELADLAHEPWALPEPDTFVGSLFVDAYRKAGLQYPRKGVAMGSIHMNLALVASGHFLAIIPGSMLRFSTSKLALKVLPVKSPVPPLPVGIMTLKRRVITPVTQLFIECAREVARPLVKIKS